MGSADPQPRRHEQPHRLERCLELDPSRRRQLTWQGCKRAGPERLFPEHGGRCLRIVGREPCADFRRLPELRGRQPGRSAAELVRQLRGHLRLRVRGVRGHHVQSPDGRTWAAEYERGDVRLLRQLRRQAPAVEPGRHQGVELPGYAGERLPEELRRRWQPGPLEDDLEQSQEWGFRAVLHQRCLPADQRVRHTTLRHPPVPGQGNTNRLIEP
mmetsp:Transcript_83442/g.255041  ORF Transcript_83442/g.255041 Transcript_83442/m.255041 type:complete len:213 (+) Transcript_83442:974-1612(+)